MRSRVGTRRELLKLAGGALAAGAGLHRVPGFAQSPQFRDADRTTDKIVALVRTFADTDPKLVRYVQKIEPLQFRIPEVKARPDELPVMDYFVGDLHLRYSFDDPRFVSNVNSTDLKRLGLKREELLPLAVANFRRLYPNLKIERPLPGLASVTNGGELEPCLMLDTQYWEAERKRADSQIIAAVPARDALIYTSRSSPQNLDALRRVAAARYAGAGKNSLSRWLFLWNYSYWEVFT
jgi:hypothetical protein